MTIITGSAVLDTYDRQIRELYIRKKSRLYINQYIQGKKYINIHKQNLFKQQLIHFALKNNTFKDLNLAFKFTTVSLLNNVESYGKNADFLANLQVFLFSIFLILQYFFIDLPLFLFYIPVLLIGKFMSFIHKQVLDKTKTIIKKINASVNYDIATLTGKKKKKPTDSSSTPMKILNIMGLSILAMFLNGTILFFFGGAWITMEKLLSMIKNLTNSQLKDALSNLFSGAFISKAKLKMNEKKLNKNISKCINKAGRDFVKSKSRTQLKGNVQGLSKSKDFSKNKRKNMQLKAMAGLSKGGKSGKSGKSISNHELKNEKEIIKTQKAMQNVVADILTGKVSKDQILQEALKNNDKTLSTNDKELQKALTGLEKQFEKEHNKENNKEHGKENALLNERGVKFQLKTNEEKGEKEGLLAEKLKDHGGRERGEELEAGGGKGGKDETLDYLEKKYKIDLDGDGLVAGNKATKEQEYNPDVTKAVEKQERVEIDDLADHIPTKPEDTPAQSEQVKQNDTNSLISQVEDNIDQQNTNSLISQVEDNIDQQNQMINTVDTPAVDGSIDNVAAPSVGGDSQIDNVAAPSVEDDDDFSDSLSEIKEKEASVDLLNNSDINTQNQPDPYSQEFDSTKQEIIQEQERANAMTQKKMP